VQGIAAQAYQKGSFEEAINKAKESQRLQISSRKYIEIYVGSISVLRQT
jgi:hypothetical protein